MPQDNEFGMQEFKFPHELEEEKNVSVSAEEDRIEIEIEDDTPEQDRGREPMPVEAVKKLEVEVDELDKYSAEAKEKMIQMKKVWHDERRAKEAASREREEAIRVAQQLLEENKKLKKAYSSGEQEYINTVKSATELELDVAKRSYKEALETGDSDRIVEAQSKLNAAAIKSDRVNNFKPSALQEQENEVQIPQLQEKAVAPDTKTREWTEKNTWFGNKKSMTAYALGLHEELIDEYGKDFVSTDQYFKRIDTAVRDAFPKYFDALEPQTQVEIEDEPQKAQPKAKPSTVVAPATRSTSSKQIKLAPRQVALARKLGLTPEQYAREFAKTGGQNG
jgi:hypothetical protein